MPMNYTDYKNALPYPGVRNKNGDAVRAAYNAEDARIYEKFKADFFAELDITDNPKKNKLFSVAWGLGHSAGYAEVMQYGYELVELIQD